MLLARLAGRHLAHDDAIISIAELDQVVAGVFRSSGSSQYSHANARRPAIPAKSPGGLIATRQCEAPWLEANRDAAQLVQR